MTVCDKKYITNKLYSSRTNIPRVYLSALHILISYVSGKYWQWDGEKVNRYERQTL